MRQIRPQTGPIQLPALRLHPFILRSPRPVEQKTLRGRKTVLRNSDLLEPRVFGLNYVLRGHKGFLNQIIFEHLVSSSDLVVAFVHKYLCAKNGL